MSVVSNLISIVYVIAFQVCGIAVGLRVFRDQRALVRLWLGSVLGSVAQMWLPILLSFFVAFTPLAQWGALVIAVAAAAVVVLRVPGARSSAIHWNELRWPIGLMLPLMVFCAYILGTHTLQMRADGAYWTGQCTWGDMSLHLGIMTSMAEQRLFPPEYSILPGAMLCYPFLSDSVSATLYQIGGSLHVAYLTPMFVALAQVFLGVWMLLRRLLRRDGRTALAFVLFFLGGGFGFAYFFEGARADPERFTRIFTAFYETPTNLIDQNIRWVNFIVDMLLPQRATLFGWSVLMPCLYLLYRAAFERRARFFVPLGVLAGALPMIHTHSFFALGLVSAAWLLFDVLRRRHALGRVVRDWLPYVLLVAVLAVPQLLFWTFRQAQGEGFVRFHFNWANQNDPYLWFWIKNVGVVFLALPFAFLLAKRYQRWMYAGAIAIFVVAELWLFQPNEYDNNKLFFVWFLLSCALVAQFLEWMYRKLRGMPGRKLLAACVLVVATLSSVLTMGREWVSELQLYGPEQVKAVAFIEEKTDVDAVFLTSSNHNNAVSSLTGRNIVCGTSSFLFFHGVNYEQAAYDARRMFEQPESFEALAAAYGVDYVFLGPYERYDFQVPEGAFDAYPMVYDVDGVTIYAVSERARARAAAEMPSPSRAYGAVER